MKLTRRQFLLASGVTAAGISLGLYLSPKAPVPHTREGSFQPNAWLQILPSGETIFQLDRSEMGQGVIASLPAILAEELDINPHELVIEMAGVHKDFVNPLVGAQLTGGSTSLTAAWQPLREAGATARYMLMQAAARTWQIDVADCYTENGAVVNAKTGARLRYAELATAATDIAIPDEVPLKDPQDFRWLGTSLPRPDSVAKVLGKIEFGSDVALADAKIAAIRRCPHFGGELLSYDDSAARQLPGVLRIFAMHSGVAVVADSYWHAQRALDKVEIRWDKGPLAGLNSATIRNQQKQLADTQEPYHLTDEGDVSADLVKHDRVVSTEYSAPYLHHSTMEPQNATAIYQSNGTMQIWAPSQGPDIAQAVAAHYSGLERENIVVHTPTLGGGFGRRSYFDYVAEVAVIAKAVPDVWVKLLWSREDDMQHDFYRPVSFHKVKAALDQQGRISSWQHTLVATSIVQGIAENMSGAMAPSWVPLGIARSLGRNLGNIAGDYDFVMAEGATVPYEVPNKRVGMVNYNPGIPTGAWRSVGHSYNAFVAESMMDELAHLANVDPVAFRLQHLESHPRHRKVLQLVAEKADWGVAAAGRFQGVALHESFDSYVAQVLEVSYVEQTLRVEKITCVVDCGFAVNPDIIAAQMESGIIYGLTAAIKPAVTIDDGAVVQSNFHDLPVLRMRETPEIEVHIVPSTQKPTGVGEVAVPPVAPALANAIFQATGQRVRDLPVTFMA